MPLYLNSSNIGGYLVSTPDKKSTKEGMPRTKFTVALNNPSKKTPEYVKCIAWGERAVTIARYATKGQEIIITGELETTTWTDRNNMKHVTTEVVVEKFNLGAKPRMMQGEATIRRPPPPIASE